VQGTYRLGFIDFLNNNAAQVRDGYFTATSSGNGSFGDITVNGAMANQNSKNTTESFNGVTYSIANTNGSGTITFPTASTPLTTLISGQKTFYASADGAPSISANVRSLYRCTLPLQQWPDSPSIVTVRVDEATRPAS